MDNNVALVEACLAEEKRRQDMLVEGWSKNITAINKWKKSKGLSEMTDMETRNVAQCLENARITAGLRHEVKMFEATTEDSIKFLGVQLPVISALLPSLILNEIASVQALDRRTGSIFYLDVQYGTSKGGATSGDTMLSAISGQNTTDGYRTYASTLVRKEVITTGQSYNTTYQLKFGYGGGVDVTTSGVYQPERAIYLTNGDGVVVATDAAVRGTFVCTTGTCTFAATTGILTIGSMTCSGGLYANYSYQYDKPYNYTDVAGQPAYSYNGVPEANVALTQSDMKAIDFPIRAKYSVGAAIDLQRAHGINLESELVKYLGGEVRWTVDHLGIDMIDKIATADTTAYRDVNGTATAMTPATAVSSWTMTSADGEPWIWRKNQFNACIEQANINIIAKTLRAQATWIIAGNAVAAVIRQLPNFKAVNMGKAPPTGPYKMGMLDNRAVFHDPMLATTTNGGAGANRYIVGYKGDSFLNAGFVMSPYIPFFATPTLVTSDLFAQKGFMTANGYKVVNSGMFTYGKVSGTMIQ